MKIQTATRIALYGNALVFALQFFANFGLMRPLMYAGGIVGLLRIVASTGTIVLFLYTLNRKQT